MQINNIADLSALLDKLNDKNKVKIIIKDFESYRNFMSIYGLYKKKFTTFIYDNKFEANLVSGAICVKNETNNFKEKLSNWLKNQKIDPKITEILQKEIE